jgi:hypothetical protein
MPPVATLAPRRHEPPAGWRAEVFEAVTEALAAALVAAYRRGGDQPARPPAPADRTAAR